MKCHVNDCMAFAHHRLVARLLGSGDGPLEEARMAVAAWKRSPDAPPFVEHWEALLDLPREELRHELLRRDEQAEALRATSPFAVSGSPLVSPEQADRLWRRMAGHAVRVLQSCEHGLYAEHLKRLNRGERRLRFWEVQSDDWIDRYVSELPPSDAVIGHFSDDGVMDGAIHVGLVERPEGDRFAEIGVSVLRESRGKGVGYHLLRRAILWARNHDADRLYSVCLVENHDMVRLARSHQAVIDRFEDEVEAVVPLPRLDCTTIAQEVLENQIGEWDFGAKCPSGSCSVSRDLLAALGQAMSGERLAKVAGCGVAGGLARYLIVMRYALTRRGASPSGTAHALATVRAHLETAFEDRPTLRTYIQALPEGGGRN